MSIGNGWPVIDVRRDPVAECITVYLRIPAELATPIEGGCSCAWCTAHPAVLPTWDCLAVCDTHGDHSWTVHYPDPRTSEAERTRGSERRTARRER